MVTVRWEREEEGEQAEQKAGLNIDLCFQVSVIGKKNPHGSVEKFTAVFCSGQTGLKPNVSASTVRLKQPVCHRDIFKQTSSI